MKTVTTKIIINDTERGEAVRVDSVDIYLYDELDDAAKARALNDYMEQRVDWIGDVFRNCAEYDVWQAVRDLENSISGAAPRWSYSPWYSCDFDTSWRIKDIDWIDPDEMEPVKDNGTCCSSDLCDAWNNHVRRLNGLARLYGCTIDTAERYPADEWEYGADGQRGERCNAAFRNRLGDLADGLRNRWIIELEAACDDVRNTIEGVLQAEWDYINSDEYARLEFEDETRQGYESRTRDAAGHVYYHDTRAWYTADGAHYCDSDIMHECVTLATR